MKIMRLDCETTGATNDTKGSAFCLDNRLCLFGYKFLGMHGHTEDIEYSQEPYGHILDSLQHDIDFADLLVGFNIKFDLHWMRRYGLKFDHKKIWDCQAFEYIHGRMKEPYPSLDKTCERYSIPGKLDTVKTEYWDNGLDTDQVPIITLHEYLMQDLIATETLYELQQKQLEYHNDTFVKLIEQENEDILTLEEMEWNGIKYDYTANEELTKRVLLELDGIDRYLNDIFGHDFINWNSPYHISACLYGGDIKESKREPYIFTYKDGRTKEKERSVVYTHKLPALIKPLKGSGLAMEGFYRTDESTLRSLKARGIAKKVIDKLLYRAKQEKLLGSYLIKLPLLAKEKGWTDGFLHGQFTNCVTATGRLASNGPNLQNFPEVIRDFIISRYK